VIYLDHNATSPVPPQVVEAVADCLRTTPGNPASLHAAGRAARAAVEQARAQVARLVGAEPCEVVFTGGGTEADNLALLGLARARRGVGRALLSGPLEHPAVGRTLRALEADGAPLTLAPVDTRGVVEIGALRAALRPDTALVSLMLANNETGVLQPVAEIAAAARSLGVPVHTDAVQAAGRIPVDFHRLGVDAMALSAHKLGGPKGVGALVLCAGASLDPILFGGGQEEGIRPGTLNVPGIVGFGAAAELARRDLDLAMGWVGALRDRLEAGLAALGGVAIGAGAARLPNTSLVAFPGVDGPALVANLDQEGVAASAGAACAAASREPPRALVALGVSPELARGAVRFSLGRENSAPQIDEVLGILSRLLRPSARARIRAAAGAFLGRKGTHGER